ncbi:phage GP46 family protein [Pseudogulbenkiania ferrooxidans]|uniref:GP46 family protein n=1 Tax=Pseudogulbenkiania ferrooxidans 2002 TaxID=279714 RepID=B9Z4Y9_9NEIS|nr:phage GP46 family protein [Pseudogulbenkiania ferrooxidans]EEG08221.1 GP46 family protein [Pseudogulbenkiania ferrooxidans 2002]
MTTRRLILDLSQPLPLELFADPIDAAIVLSLFSDARAPDSEALPDPRGWWGDALAEHAGDTWGGQLWLLARRAKNVPETLRRAEDYARDALKWMVADGVSSTLAVAASDLGNETMLLAITLDGITINLEVSP